MDKDFLFTSESVSEGHPDKICDQISDAILDEHLKGDPESRVAVDVMVSSNNIFICGEVTSKVSVEYDIVARKVVKNIGYTDPDLGFDSENCNINIHVHPQSPDISQGVTEGDGLYSEQGAGDQGMMFGYAVAETEELMPMPILYSHKILKKLSDFRKSGKVSFLRPDSKAQVTVEYKNSKPVRLDTVVLSTQHSPEVEHKEIYDLVVDELIPSIILSDFIDKNTKFFVNPTGRFVIGGPYGDTGLTGRKIIVDTYGGMGRHGGGAFSGKDPSKVDRSAAYMGRYIAKNIVAAGLAYRCEVEIAYAIGVPFPVSVMVDTFNTGIIPDVEIAKIVNDNFDLRPAKIISNLNLKKPIYLETSVYGHFGRPSFSWESLNKVDELINK